MKDYDYNLPDGYIAQKPVIPRDECKLMVIDRKTENIMHFKFKDIVNFLNKGDVLILNNSRVIYARLKGKKKTGAKIEVFLLRELEPSVWEVLVKPGKRVKKGTVVEFSNIMKGEVIGMGERGIRIIHFDSSLPLKEAIKKIGEIPLPPYIKEEVRDPELYQTVYSKDEGSVAAPTAGLHFTEKLLFLLEDKGVKIGYVTLHVGIDTFRSIEEEDVRNHKMHREYFKIPEETANMINEAKEGGYRVIAVGTTTVRTLESKAKNGKVDPGEGETDLYIYPGYKFKLIDGIITNFHLPRSSLLVMMAAWMGRDLLFKSYNEAIERGYRFFSFGDAMFVY